MSKKSNAATHEPPPTGNGTVIITELITDLLSRNKAGTLKYGTTLRVNNGRDSLMDAYQEACDLCMYLKQALMEQEAKEEKVNFKPEDFCDQCDHCNDCQRDYIVSIKETHHG